VEPAETNAEVPVRTKQAADPSAQQFFAFLPHTENLIEEMSVFVVVGLMHCLEKSQLQLQKTTG